MQGFGLKDKRNKGVFNPYGGRPRDKFPKDWKSQIDLENETKYITPWKSRRELDEYHIKKIGDADAQQGKLLELDQRLRNLDQTFESRFKYWLQGRDSNLNHRHVTPWGHTGTDIHNKEYRVPLSANLLFQDEEAQQYVMAPLRKQQEFFKFLAEMRIRGPRNLGEKYLYFKYLVWPAEEFRKANPKFLSARYDPFDPHLNPTLYHWMDDYRYMFENEDADDWKDPNSRPPVALKGYFHNRVLPKENDDTTAKQKPSLLGCGTLENFPVLPRDEDVIALEKYWLAYREKGEPDQKLFQEVSEPMQERMYAQADMVLSREEQEKFLPRRQGRLRKEQAEPVLSDLTPRRPSSEIMSEPRSQREGEAGDKMDLEPRSPWESEDEGTEHEELVDKRQQKGSERRKKHSPWHAEAEKDEKIRNLGLESISNEELREVWYQRVDKYLHDEELLKSVQTRKAKMIAEHPHLDESKLERLIILQDTLDGLYEAGENNADWTEVEYRSAVEWEYWLTAEIEKVKESLVQAAEQQETPAASPGTMETERLLAESERLVKRNEELMRGTPPPSPTIEESNKKAEEAMAKMKEVEGEAKKPMTTKERKQKIEAFAEKTQKGSALMKIGPMVMKDEAFALEVQKFVDEWMDQSLQNPGYSKDQESYARNLLAQNDKLTKEQIEALEENRLIGMAISKLIEQKKQELSPEQLKLLKNWQERLKNQAQRFKSPQAGKWDPMKFRAASEDEDDAPPPPPPGAGAVAAGAQSQIVLRKPQQRESLFPAPQNQLVVRPSQEQQQQLFPPIAQTQQLEVKLSQQELEEISKLQKSFQESQKDLQASEKDKKILQTTFTAAVKHSTQMIKDHAVLLKSFKDQIETLKKIENLAGFKKGLNTLARRAKETISNVANNKRPLIADLLVASLGTAHIQLETTDRDALANLQNAERNVDSLRAQLASQQATYENLINVISEQGAEAKKWKEQCKTLSDNFAAEQENTKELAKMFTEAKENFSKQKEIDMNVINEAAKAMDQMQEKYKEAVIKYETLLARAEESKQQSAEGIKKFYGSLIEQLMGELQMTDEEMQQLGMHHVKTVEEQEAFKLKVANRIVEVREQTKKQIEELEAENDELADQIDVLTERLRGYEEKKQQIDSKALKYNKKDLLALENENIITQQERAEIVAQKQQVQNQLVAYQGASQEKQYQLHQSIMNAVGNVSAVDTRLASLNQALTVHNFVNQNTINVSEQAVVALNTLAVRATENQKKLVQTHNSVVKGIKRQRGALKGTSGQMLLEGAQPAQPAISGPEKRLRIGEH